MHMGYIKMLEELQHIAFFQDTENPHQNDDSIQKHSKLKINEQKMLSMNNNEQHLVIDNTNLLSILDSNENKHPFRIKDGLLTIK